MRDVQDLINMEKLREALKTGEGEGVRVAVLDTGVEASHPDLHDSVKSCHNVAVIGRGRMVAYDCQPTEGEDPVGHGTACAGIIHRIAPKAEIHSVSVIGANASGTLNQLIHGIEWAIAQQMDVINLSLGTVGKQMQSKLIEVIDQAYFQGVLLVAAASNRQTTSYPSDSASLIGVDNQSFSDPISFHYRLGRPIELEAHGIYVQAPAPGGGQRLFTGTSFACPHVSGIVARLRSVYPNLTSFQAKMLLYCLRDNVDPC